MRVLGIDYGRRRLGVAISDEEQILASPLPPLTRTGSDDDLLRALGDLVNARSVGEIVVGLPINMDGSHGEMSEEVSGFAEELRRALRLPVHTFDERMTSMEADRVLIEANITRKRRKLLRDGLAAVLILQGFLDRRRRDWTG
jgi:putative Holliday junction resolvase